MPTDPTEVEIALSAGAVSRAHRLSAPARDVGHHARHNRQVDRLLIVTAFASTGGGAERWLLGILREPALRNAGWVVDAIVMQDGPLVELLMAERVTTITMPIPASPIGIMRRVPALRRAILARGPDVVVSNGVKAQLAVSAALAGSGIPSIWVKHDHSYDALLGRPLGRAASLVVPTALEVGLPTGRRDLIVIEPPRPEPPLSSEDARAQLSALGWHSTRRLTLGMITRLVPYKGVDLAIEALADRRNDEWELVVIGGNDPSTPHEAERLADLAQRLGVTDRLFLAGEINGAGRLLKAMDAVAVLTRPGQQGAPTKEGYGIVASEAMTAGVPVVVAQAGPITRRLATPEGPAGLTLSSPDAAALSDALCALCDDTIRAEMGRRGLAVSESMPTQAEVAQQFTETVIMARNLR